jgi:multidrug efflux system membrane fusion protein
MADQNSATQSDASQQEAPKPASQQLQPGSSAPKAVDRVARAHQRRRILGVVISIGSVLSAVVAVSACVLINWVNPRTDDAEVFANYIGIAPLVEGPITQVNVHDNQFVKQGDLLFTIDDRPYRYALEKAMSDQSMLEAQIEDERRKIAGQGSAVVAASANLRESEANVDRAANVIDGARAALSEAKAGAERAQAQWQYSKSNLERIEPLLKRQFVTADQVDQAHSLERTNLQALNQAKAQVTVAEARLKESISALAQAKAQVGQSNAQQQQSMHNVLTIDPFTAQRQGKLSAIQSAQYNLDNTKVYAPFDARVTNLTISQGQYARIGTQVFTLIDTRRWWVVGNFRETQLRHVQPGTAADIYLMPQNDRPLRGTVESVGYGVIPDPTLIGTLSPGLPDVQRTLNWVHLATRYPVRVLVNDPPPNTLRIGQTAIVVMRGSRRPDGSVAP